MGIATQPSTQQEEKRKKDRTINTQIDTNEWLLQFKLVQTTYQHQIEEMPAIASTLLYTIGYSRALMIIYDIYMDIIGKPELSSLVTSTLLGHTDTTTTT